MTEYTPTTWKMRNIYLDWRDEDAANEPLTISDIHEEFDRWLAELVRKEREEAWEEGRDDGHHPQCLGNPYSNGSNET